MDRQLVKQFRADMQSVLDASDLSKNLTIEVGNATFDEDTVTFKVVLKKDGALSKEAKDLVGMAGLHDLDINKIGTHGLNTYSLVGYKSRARKKPWIVQNLTKGGEYIIDTDTAKKLFSREEVV